MGPACFGRGDSPPDMKPAIEAAADGEGDHHRILLKLTQRMDRVGLTFPGVEVRWEHLMVEVAKPQRCMRPESKQDMLLNAGSGTLPPGRMCLLLGPPGGGRSTFLRALSGQLITSATRRSSWFAGGGGGGGGSEGMIKGTAGLRMHGKVLYNGLPANGSAFVVGRTASYVGQTENHMGELTVEETLTFAAECQGSKLAKRVHEVLVAAEKAAGIGPQHDELETLLTLARGPHASKLYVEMVAQSLGIDHVMATLVGDDMHKGISGGQKRRVTVGEMSVGLAQVQMLDEITNGLDAASALSIVRSLRNMCVHSNATILATLLQPSPEVFDCFHDVILLTHGRIVFHGPREELLPFFASLALAPLPAQTAADFAQEVTACPADQAKYRVAPADGSAAAPWAGRAWLSPRRIEEAFRASATGQENARLVAQPPYTHALQDLVLHKERFGLSPPRMWALAMRREVTLALRNGPFFIAGVAQVLFTGFLLATLFVNTKQDTMNDANLYMSVIFFSLQTIFMGGFNFAPIYVKRLGVFYKQRDQHFLSPTAYAISCTIMRLPELTVQAAAFGVLVYFSVGFTMDAGRFFLFFLNLIVAGFNSITTFQMIGALTRSETTTQGLGAVSLMVNVLVSGFPIARSSIPGWWIWFYYASPMSWSLRSMALTELTSDAWALEDPSNPDSNTVGEAVLLQRGFFTEWFWVWAGIGVVIGISLLQVGIQIVALSMLGPLRAARQSENDFGEDDDAHVVVPMRSNFYDESEYPMADKTASTGLATVPGAAPAKGVPVPAAATPFSTSASGDGEAPLDEQLAVAAGQQPAPRNPSSLRPRPPSPSGAPSPANSGVLVVATEMVGQQPSGGHASSGRADRSRSGHASGGGGAAWAEPVAVVVAGAPASGAAAAAATGAAASAAGVLSFRPVVMTFANVSYFVPHPSEKGKKLQLLDHVSGVFRPGVLTSLMGASGAGKTTLMDVLTGRKTGGSAEGEQRVNGEPKRMSKFARIMGYVEQFDAHNPFATVEEALVLSARLRVSSAVLPYGAVRGFVHRMMEVVELRPLAERTIGLGGAAGGLSTEARKRLTIACELVANPSIVFMDEPTTGLDARAAGLVMRAVRNTVATGRTVVCTIHQPNREIMDYFDELLLLKPGGRVIYNGPLGERQSALVAHLSSVPGVPSYEPQMNPANWMLEVTSPAAEAAMGLDFARIWEASEGARRTAALITELSSSPAAAAKPGAGASTGDVEAAAAAQPGPRSDSHTSASSAADAGTDAGSGGSGGAGRYSQPLLVQLRLLFHRALLSQARNTNYNVLRIAITLALAAVLGSLYWGAGKERNTVIGLMNVMGILFSGSLFVSMVNMLMVMPLILAERAVFYREKASGMYHPAVFAAAQGLAEVPFLFAQSVLYVVIMYCTVQFEFTASKMLFFWLYMFLDLVLFTMMGLGAANCAPNMPAVTAGCSFAILLWNLLCGFLVYRKDIKPWYIWGYWCNPTMWIIYGCVTTQFGDLTDEFIDTGSETMSVAQYVQETYGYDYDMRGWIVLILLAWIVFFRLLSYLGLVRLNFQRR